MKKEIYEKNMQAMEKKYPVWANLIGKKKRKQRNFTVMAEESMMGETILKVDQNGKMYYLNGKYAPSAVADRWLEQHDPIAEYTPIIIIGISNGYHIRRILEEKPKTANVLIYEPSFELFKREMEEVDLSFLFAPDIPVGIIVEGLNEEETEAYFHLMISYDNMASLLYYKSGNYSKLFPNEIEQFVSSLKKYVTEQEVTWNTLVRYTDVKAKNTFYNLPYLYEGYSVGELCNILPSDVPTIVVSAGPSLNKNIMELKKAVGKACIIATDTAMKPLLNAGIMPNLFVIIDGLKPGVLFEHKDLSKVPMVTMTGVSVEPMQYHKGKKFFYYSSSPYEQKILSDLGAKEGAQRTLPNIISGGSVACNAFSLGVMMGSRTVILVGQDLAMTGNRTHADGTFKDKMDEIDQKSGEYFEVESIDGGKVLTRDDFNRYRKWFEKIAQKWQHVKMIDATEGGALIHGSKVMTLKGAIRKYCTREFNVKWHVDHTRKLFNGENRSIALSYFENAPKKLTEVRKKAKDGLHYYEQLEKLLKKPSHTDAQLQGILKKIKKINNYIERDYMAETVMDSLCGLEYTLRPNIYKIYEDQKSELMDVSGQGKLLLYAISVATEEITGIANETIVPYAKKEKQKIL
jgi:hypothetical protein